MKIEELVEQRAGLQYGDRVRFKGEQQQEGIVKEVSPSRSFAKVLFTGKKKPVLVPIESLERI